jgi:hypothetical protein
MVGVIVAIVVVVLLVLRYQYLQMFPQLARGDANKVFVIPSSEFFHAMSGIGDALGKSAMAGGGDNGGGGAAGPQEPQSE